MARRPGHPNAQGPPAAPERKQRQPERSHESVISRPVLRSCKSRSHGRLSTAGGSNVAGAPLQIAADETLSRRLNIWRDRRRAVQQRLVRIVGEHHGPRGRCLCAAQQLDEPRSICEKTARCGRRPPCSSSNRRLSRCRSPKNRRRLIRHAVRIERAAPTGARRPCRRRP